jgi:hypothetical protein
MSLRFHIRQIGAAAFIQDIFCVLGAKPVSWYTIPACVKNVISGVLWGKNVGAFVVSTWQLSYFARLVRPVRRAQ